MGTTIFRHGRTVIPAEIRKRHKIKPGDHLTWVDDGQTIRVIPVPTDVITLYGSGKEQALKKKLLEEQ